MRCAIYTRKSTEEGLNQEFNSLDAQREAAEAYILSQRQAGWVTLPEPYDDGGFTGANLERPALQRLLADIEAGKVDAVTVYKVDRLSRSLLDFARLMGVFEKRGVHFISVTQPFNTTASLGRLTLNILLSFAQFERELVVERTRDKMAAARRKGKWVGGIPVLGYDVAAGGGRLVINEEEARQVRAIFALYLEHRALLPVLIEIQRRRWTTKRWITQAGRVHAGRALVQKDVVALLSNRIYAGKIHYQGQSYPGEHPAIIEERVFEPVQRLLQENRRPARPVRRCASTNEVTEATAHGVRPPKPSPRIATLLALALKFEGLIHKGVIKDYAELARLGQISRSRVTQIMNLLNLSVDIQEEILAGTEAAPGTRSVTETTVRALSAEVSWSRQRELWRNHSTRTSTARGTRIAGNGSESRAD
jgi:DNA invertase Pin-like site-specific DNA recombinase